MLNHNIVSSLQGFAFRTPGTKNYRLRLPYDLHLILRVQFAEACMPLRLIYVRPCWGAFH